jgi:hypothetical protein
MIIKGGRKVMEADGREKSTCELTCQDKPPTFLKLDTAPGIEIKGHAFILSPPPCCSQTALPFWAKVIGGITNNRSEEITVRVAVRLFDGDGSLVATYSDDMMLEGGEKGEFDVKLTDFERRAGLYSLEVEATDEPKAGT